MSTLIIACTVSRDDAAENQSSGDTSATEVTPFFGLAGSFFGFTGMRFPGVSGLSGVTIDDAVVEFHAKVTDIGDFDADWAAENTADPALFTAGSANTDISSRTLTTATCEADGTDYGEWTAGVLHDFPPAGYSGDNGNEVLDLLQEVVDSLDPSAFVLIETLNSGFGERGWASVDDGVNPPPELTIDYTESGGAAIMNQLQGSNLGADLYDGVLSL